MLCFFVSLGRVGYQNLSILSDCDLRLFILVARMYDEIIIAILYFTLRFMYFFIDVVECEASFFRIICETFQILVVCRSKLEGKIYRVIFMEFFVEILPHLTRIFLKTLTEIMKIYELKYKTSTFPFRAASVEFFTI